MTTVTLQLGNMVPPTPGADPMSRLFGSAVPADGAGPVGPDQYWPEKLDVPPGQALAALNPLQHLPLVGMIYREATGQTLPAPLRIAGSVAMGFATGSPVGAFGTILLAFIGRIIEMGPDRTGPAVPAGMQLCGNEAPISPIDPLAPSDVARDGIAPGAIMTMADYDRTLLLEKGIA